MSFHLFQVTEIYSNANGTVQFIELSTAASGQQFLGGHAITVSDGDTTNSFTFPSDLPGTTPANFLIATKGFADLGIVTPDYIVPTGFLFPGGGTVNFGPGADIFSYTALPLDGDVAVSRLAGILTEETASPGNLAGDTGTLGSGIALGEVFAGTSAANVLTGGAGHDGLFGAAGNDTMNGGSGNDFLNGGSGADRLDGGTGNDTIRGGLHNDKLNGGAGADHIQGDAGNDTMTWSATDFFNGNAGTDILKVTSGNLDLTATSNSRIVGTETVDMTGGSSSTLTLTKSEVLAISNTTDTLTVLGTAGDTVNLMGAFVMTGTAGGFDTWKLGAAIVKIDTDLTVI